MKRQVIAKPNIAADYRLSKTRTIEDVPDIDNTQLELDDVLSWIDELIEVHGNEEDNGNK